MRVTCWKMLNLASQNVHLREPGRSLALSMSIHNTPTWGTPANGLWTTLLLALALMPTNFLKIIRINIGNCTLARIAKIPAVFALCLMAIQGECLAAQAKHDWYPRSSDLCSEYVTKMLKPEAGAKLVTPTKDPAIRQYISDFNLATGTDDKGGKALIALLGYCMSHAAEKLGDVGAQTVIDNYAAAQSGQTVQSANPQQPQVEATPPDTLTQCLQETADSVTAWYKASGQDQDPAVLLNVIGLAQKTKCGYSAIDTTPPPVAPADSAPEPSYFKPVTPIAPSQTGFYRGQKIQGQLRVCYYNVLGNIRTITLNAWGTCLPTAQFAPP